MLTRASLSLLTSLHELDEISKIQICLDACLVDNGGCDCNAICSHDPKTFATVCTCKTGYTNTGSAVNVTCTGKIYLYNSS